MRTFVFSCLVMTLCVQVLHTTEAFPREPQAVPDLEVLEFLGAWETEDGELIDPLSLEMTSEPDPSTGESRRGASSPRTGSTHEADVGQPRSDQPDDDDLPWGIE